MYAVGEAVRVTSVDKTRSDKGIISMVNGDSTYDIIYTSHKLAAGNDEELAVSASRIAPLLMAEIDNPVLNDINDADLLKSTGNALFALKDINSALVYYKRALIVLFQSAVDTKSGDKAYTIGQGVIISYPDSLDCSTGIISDVSEGSADVMSDDCDVEEEIEVPFHRLAQLASGVRNGLLQRSLYLNMAKCVLKQEQKGWAIKHSSMALAVTHHLQALVAEGAPEVPLTEMEVKKLLADGYYFRGKALLQAHRPRFAAQDCKRLAQYDVSKAASLDGEIQTFKKNAAKSNRKLARDIASWVSTAMSESGGRKANSLPEGDGDDLGVLGEGDEDDEGEAREGPATGKQDTGNRNRTSDKHTSPSTRMQLRLELTLCVFVLACAMYYMFANQESLS